MKLFSNQQSPLKNSLDQKSIGQRPKTHGAKAAIGIASLGCIMALTGCLSRPAMKQETFLFGIPTVTTTTSATNSPVLALKKVEIAAPYADHALVYRTADFTYVRDPYAGFLDAPEQDLLAALRSGFSRSGDFSAIVNTSSALSPDLIAEVSVTELYGDFRTAGKPQAVLSLRIIICSATNGIASAPILQKEYSRHIPISAASASALVSGWNHALTQIMNDVLADYRQRKN